MSARDKERLITTQKMLRLARDMLKRISDGDERDPRTAAWLTLERIEAIEIQELRP